MSKEFTQRCEAVGLKEGSLFTWLEKVETLQAENAALKEQVAQLELIKDEHDERGIDIDILVQNLNSVKAKLTTLQSKSAALVDALEAYPDFGEYFMENLEATDMKNAALAAFKGEK